MALIPDSKKEAFKEFANNDSSVFALGMIADGIYRHSRGEDLKDVKESFLAEDWGGVNEESNRERGTQVYNQMVGFLETDK